MLNVDQRVSRKVHEPILARFSTGGETPVGGEVKDEFSFLTRHQRQYFFRFPARADEARKLRRRQAGIDHMSAQPAVTSIKHRIANHDDSFWRRSSRGHIPPYHIQSSSGR